MDYQINGTVMQTVELTMKGGESVHTESGGMAWHTGDFRMATNMAGGVLSAIGR